VNAAWLRDRGGAGVNVTRDFPRRAKMVGQLHANRDVSQKIWANLHTVGQPCEPRVVAAPRPAMGDTAILRCLTADFH
jgi:hypothetical protein